MQSGCLPTNTCSTSNLSTIWHKTTRQLILSDMGCFRYLKLNCIDIWDKICNNKWRSLLLALCSVVGVVIGVVLFNVSKDGWWYCNRVDYAERLFNGGFSLFLFFLLWTSVFYLCLLFCNIIPATKFLNCVLQIVVCLYVGANTAATIVCFSVWGVLFCIFVSVEEVVFYYVACLIAFCEPSPCRTFRETFCDLRQCAAILTAAFIVKIVGFFVILRLLTAII